MKTKLIIITLCTIVALHACKDEYNICSEPKTVKFVASIFQKNGTADVLTTVPTFSLVNQAGNVLIYNNESNINTFSISLNNLLDSARYIVTLSSSLPKDTITIIYSTSGTTNTSLDCGPLFNHNIIRLRTTLNTVDSIVNFNPTINNSLSLNAKIYF